MPSQHGERFFCLFQFLTSGKIGSLVGSYTYRHRLYSLPILVSFAESPYIEQSFAIAHVETLVATFLAFLGIACVCSYSGVGVLLGGYIYTRPFLAFGNVFVPITAAVHAVVHELWISNCPGGMVSVLLVAVSVTHALYRTFASSEGKGIGFHMIG